MKCAACGGAVKTVVSTKDAPYHYTESGLDNVYLVGIQVRQCSGCGEAPVLRDLPALHRVIASVIASAPVSPLGFREMGFLCHFAAENIPRARSSKRNPYAKLADVLGRIAVMFERGTFTDEHRGVLETLLRQAVLSVLHDDDGEMLLRGLSLVAENTFIAKDARFTIRRSSGATRPWRAEADGLAASA